MKKPESPRRNRCVPASKLSYSTLDDAMNEIAVSALFSRERKIAAYPCEHCKGYHIGHVNTPAKDWPLNKNEA